MSSAESAPEWFSQFADFAYDTRTNFKANFDRLAAHRNWGPKLKNKRWTECLSGTIDGSDADFKKLEKWQALCHEVRITNVPDSITGCKKALGSREILVNIVNLIDHRLSRVPLIRFQNYGAFHKYTTKGRIFPLNKAKEEGFINALLRRL
ncbi:hypothetical protein IQ07DRAFT_604415 [Pyrenochaeta sp. DS3sAY3a]|nr:hypothetical protein IQ07DRAFT_604415 [Pyrenochaeta sp. DS3sAY3a]